MWPRPVPYMTMSEYIRKPSQNYFEKFREGCLEKTTTEKEDKRESWGLSYTKKRAPHRANFGKRGSGERQCIECRKAVRLQKALFSCWLRSHKNIWSRE